MTESEIAQGDAPRPAARWSVRVAGHPFDIDYLKHAFGGGETEFVDVQTTESKTTYMLSKAFGGLATVDAVKAEAAKLLERVNGILRMHGHQPVAFDGVREAKADGTVGHHVFITAHVQGRSYAKAVASGGAPVSGPSGPTKALLAASQNPHLAAALELLGRATTWPELFKVWEAIEEHAGGEERLKKMMSNAQLAQNRRFHSTAEPYRHYDQKRQIRSRLLRRKTPPEMSQKEAVQYLSSVLRILLS